ncbi:DUF300-domain-containing protein [Calocera cornea HHB12733]|uniref:DUF300-domain-containing protein n=1 Tax=Calocera cornea HHB12733 TaxID=1353952 RepID=A0A165F010_9BASI|nr:DUF300-domain-containing protein [Calocera cornea HHB12733]
MWPALGGSGSALTPILLVLCGLSTLIATGVGAASVYFQLKNYRQPHLQRQVIRIMIMVPLYAISSLISLFSLEAAFFIDAFRDIYEAYVIYCFFHLLLAYLGGDRALLIMLHGRPPKTWLPPVNLFKSECDVSDPFVFLGLRRGIFQYVQIKPILAVATMILKATNHYHEGTFRPTDGYLYISVIYNTSICVSLYCLAMFWKVVHDDIQPFRPVPKFLCVKGILFFSFWQSIFISILAASGAISRLGPYTDQEHIAIGINDMLICFEMPLFAFAHWYAFNYHDYVDVTVRLAARMPFYYALRDAFGVKDVVEDAKATMEGGMSYRYYEPAEGGMHQGSGRERRIRAGLRYAQGGKKKYWLPLPRHDATMTTGPISAVNKRWEEREHEHEAYAPLMAEQQTHIVHTEHGEPIEDEYAEDEFDRTSLDFDLPGRVDENDQEVLYAKSRLLEFGDGNYPVIDCSDEAARRWMREVEEGIVSGRMSAVGRGLRERVRLLSEPGAGIAAAVPGYGTLPPGSTHHGGGSGSGPATLERSQSTDGQPGKGKGKKTEERTSTYGAWAEIASEIHAPRPVPSVPPMPPRDRSRSRSANASPAPSSRAVVDLAPPPPDLDVDGVRLHLSRKRPGHASVGSLSPPQSQMDRTRSPLVPPSPAGSGSRQASRTHTPTMSAPGGKPLPADAVDLLIEDPEENVPPGTRGSDSQRVVYRRGVPGEEGKEVRVEHQGGETRVEVGRPKDGPETIAQVAPNEPPKGQVSVLVERYDMENNPWA